MFEELKKYIGVKHTQVLSSKKLSRSLFSGVRSSANLSVRSPVYKLLTFLNSSLDPLDQYNLCTKHS